MHLRRHEDRTATTAPDPMATAVWQSGLGHRPAGSPVIRAPHASELVENEKPTAA